MGLFEKRSDRSQGMEVVRGSVERPLICVEKDVHDGYFQGIVEWSRPVLHYSE